MIGNTQSKTLADVRYPHMKVRRDRLRELKLCINGERHGAATRGVRCEHCYWVHRLGFEAATERGL